MNVDSLFAQLSYGELSNLAIGMEGSGGVLPAMQPSIITHANQVLTDIYSQMAHKVCYVNLELVEDQTVYRVHPKHAVTTEPLDNGIARYIQDTADNPFTHEIIKIMDIHEVVDTNEDGETKINLNNVMDTSSIRTLSYDTVLVPDPVAGIQICLECQVNHLPLSTSPVNPTEEIELLPAMQAALVAKVAARVYSTMNGEENAAKAERLKSEYEAALRLVKQEDLAPDSSAAVTKKMYLGGWP